jgi:hypothetical protein
VLKRRRRGGLPGPELPLVVAGLFAGTPFAAYLEGAAAEIATLERIDDRSRLVRCVVGKRPIALLLPAIDRRGRATSPLVAACWRDAPEVRSVLLLGSDSRGVDVVAAVRAHARVVGVDTMEQLRDVLLALVEESDESAV